MGTDCNHVRSCDAMGSVYYLLFFTPFCSGLHSGQYLYTERTCNSCGNWLVPYTSPFAFRFRGQPNTLEMEPFNGALHGVDDNGQYINIPNIALTSSLSQPIISPNDTCVPQIK